CLMARKHVLLEKPIGLELKHADELMQLARAHRLKLTIGNTQRFNPRYAYVKQCVVDGTIGQPVTALVSRNVSRSIGNKIGGRVHLSPAVMEATHDIHFIEAVAGDRPVLVTPEEARLVMEVTLAADLSAERNAPVSLPLD